MAHVLTPAALLGRVAPGAGERPLLVRLVQRLEGLEAIDLVAVPEQRLAEKLVADPRVRAVLLGRQLGHALHPLLTDVPLGSWTSAVVLDVVGGRQSRRAAQRLVALGCLAAVPTIVTGFAEWVGTEGGDRRVGYVHAVANGAALGLLAASWWYRRKDRHRLGVALGLAGMGVGGAGAYLGGHLSVARGIGSRDPAFSDNPLAREMSSDHRG